jgi:hypothetical protein
MLTASLFCRHARDFFGIMLQSCGRTNTHTHTATATLTATATATATATDTHTHTHTHTHKCTTHAQQMHNTRTTHPQHRHNTRTTYAQHTYNTRTTHAQHMHNTRTTHAQHTHNTLTTHAQHMHNTRTRAHAHTIVLMSSTKFLLTGFENTVCLSVRFVCAGTRGCVVDPTAMVGSNCALSRTRPSVSSCFTAILLAVPADGYWPNLAWIGQQTSLHSLFLAISDVFQLEVFLLSTKLLMVILLYHHYKIYYKFYYVTSVATLCYCFAVIFRLRLHNVLLSLVFLIQYQYSQCYWRVCYCAPAPASCYCHYPTHVQ